MVAFRIGSVFAALVLVGCASAPDDPTKTGAWYFMSNPDPAVTRQGPHGPMRGDDKRWKDRR
ncbi:MAG TPA: hypothetical protein VMP03_01475 [Methylomirabilota bacterium]|nr:hypothetical protein [Methylomirabilota bacterium]